MPLPTRAFVLVLFMVVSQACAQKQDDAVPPAVDDSTVEIRHNDTGQYMPRWYSMVTDIPGDWVRFGTTVFRPESMPYIATVGAMTAGLVVLDPRSYRTTHNLYETNPAVHSASDVIIHVGDGKTGFGIAGAFALYGFIAHDNRAMRTGSQIGEVVLASGIVVQLLKRVTGRESPEKCVTSHSRWRMFPSWRAYNHNQGKYYSFPSGHTTTIMGVVTVIAENYPEVKWIRPVGYSLVGLVGASLVNVGWHWYSDLPLAVALGYTFGRIAAHPFGDVDESGSNENGPKVTIAPLVRPEGSGIALALSF